MSRVIELSVVVPVYKEEGNITPFLDRLIPVMERIHRDYEIIFCVDPADDQTENIILDSCYKNNKIKAIFFSRRFGQPLATIAGIHNCSGNACIIIDVDLQDQPEHIVDLYFKYKEGFDVVYATRKNRDGESLIKKLIASIGYKLINRITDIKIPENTGDFRLISRRVINELNQFNEHSAFLRGLISYIGYKQTQIYYNRDRRYSGAGNYNKFLGSLKIGFNGIFGFSAKPLFMMSFLGIIFSLVGFLSGFIYLIQKISGVNFTPGLTSTIIFITFFSGIQLMGLGIMGEYIGRIFEQVSNRPKYIIDKKINIDNE